MSKDRLGFNLSSTTPYCMCIECCVFVHLMMSGWGLKYNTWSKSTYLVAFTSFFAIPTLKKKFLPHSCYAHSAFQCIQIAKKLLQSPYFKLILYCSHTLITWTFSALFIHLASFHQIISYIYCFTFIVIYKRNCVPYLSINYCFQLKFALSFCLISTNFGRNGNPSIPKFMHCSKER